MKKEEFSVHKCTHNVAVSLKRWRHFCTSTEISRGQISRSILAGRALGKQNCIVSMITPLYHESSTLIHRYREKWCKVARNSRQRANGGSVANLSRAKRNRLKVTQGDLPEMQRLDTAAERFDVTTNHIVNDVHDDRAEERGACRWRGSPYFRRTISGRTPTYISVRQTVHTPCWCPQSTLSSSYCDPPFHSDKIVTRHSTSNSSTRSPRLSRLAKLAQPAR